MITLGSAQPGSARLDSDDANLHNYERQFAPIYYQSSRLFQSSPDEERSVLPLAPRFVSPNFLPFFRSVERMKDGGNARSSYVLPPRQLLRTSSLDNATLLPFFPPSLIFMARVGSNIIIESKLCRISSPEYPGTYRAGPPILELAFFHIHLVDKFVKKNSIKIIVFDKFNIGILHFAGFSNCRLCRHCNLHFAFLKQFYNLGLIGSLLV